jgi:PIN domain nuclease of toxin-antitoxin system
MGTGSVKAFLDTHTAIFLWEGRNEVFGPNSRKVLEEAILLISPMVRLEMTFLKEVGKLKVEPDHLLGSLNSDLGVTMTSEPLETLIPLAMPLSWTRDPFDRLIVATALLHQAPLVTRDTKIRENFQNAIW